MNEKTATEESGAILIVDDSTANLQLLMSILSGQGYVVYPASDGELALRFLNSNLPDLILLDIRMPGMDGIELCRQLKADKRTRDIPVIFISIIEKEHEKVKAFQAGGADYISKPFQPEEVLARVAHQLRLKRLTERLEKKILERTEELTKANRHLHAEIAVRKHAEDALRKSEALLNATQRLSKVGGWEFDVKTGKVFWTDELYNIHEMARDSTIDHIQESLFCYRDEDRQIIMEAFKNAYKNGKPYDLDFPFITRKGRHLWIRTTAMPIYEGSEIVSVIGNMMDITERKLMEESLRRSEQYQRTLLDNFPFFVWLKDKESRLLAANVQFARVAKVASTSELEGKTDFDFFPHDLASKYVADDRAVMETGRPKYDEEMYVDENGARHWMETWKSPLVVDGAMVGTVGYSRDITERREYAEQLREAHEFTEMVLNAIPDPVFVKDRDHKYKLVNNALCVLLGQPRNVLLGISDYDFLPAKQADVFWENDDLVFNSGEEMINDETITDAEGRVRIIQTKRALAGPDNLIGVIRDLTDMKQLKVAKEMAEKARQAAEDANKAKSIFLANMSHELRTPLNAILGFSRIMQNDSQITESQQQNIDIINRSGEHLLRLINDILDMAKIEAGQVRLANEPFDLGAMLRDVTDMMRVRAGDKELSLQIDQASQFPRYIVGDEARLRQVLINLMGNAIKYTKQGGVILRLNTTRNQQTHLMIQVEDTGMGIPAKEQKHIFEPFVQLGAQDVSRGTGLGLTITRQFVEMMGGSISLDSVLDKGSLFTVSLPLVVANESDIKHMKPADATNIIGLTPGQPEYRILIVEDQRENQLLLAKLMEEVGFHTMVADNGAQAVELCESWRPHLIWMDQRMPEMDGMEATRRIRKLPDGNKVKIVAVTASAFAEQRSEMMAAGMDDYVRKPYRAAEIYNCLTKHLGVEYIYKDVEEITDLDSALTPEMLEGLSEDLLGELREALESLDYDRIEGVVQRIALQDKALQRKLDHLVQNYNYPAILQLLQKAD